LANRELYLAVEKILGRSSVEMTRKLAREMGATFSDHDASEWLRPFTAAAHEKRTNAERVRAKNLARRNTPRTHGAAHGESHEKRTKNALTRDKELVPKDPDVQAPTEPATLAAQTTLIPVTTGPKLAGKPRPGHLILDAVGELVKPHLHSMTLRQWRTVNATVAHDLAEAGETPRSVAAFWESELRRTGTSCVVLRYLQERMTTSTSRGSSPTPSAAAKPVLSDVQRRFIEEEGAS
jgi:hypothetical protein